MGCHSTNKYCRGVPKKMVDGSVDRHFLTVMVLDPCCIHTTGLDLLLEREGNYCCPELNFIPLKVSLTSSLEVNLPHKIVRQPSAFSNS